MDQRQEIELVFAPQEEGGYHVYAPDLPGLHTQGDTLEEATANAQEALDLYVEGLREDGHSVKAILADRRAAGSGMSEEEAMRVAVQEQHAYRR